MSFVIPTEQDSALSTALEKISQIDREIDVAELAVKELKKKRDVLANIAVEEMTAGRLDGVRVAGRSWRVEWDHSVSATADNKDAVLAAARAAGMKEYLTKPVRREVLQTLLEQYADQHIA